MAGTGLLALLDDITTLLDDVATISKVAATKTAGISGDDLAVNSQAVIGVDPARELPVVWAVAKGSFKNKLILIPAALAVNAALPVLITPILMAGGAYLCYEGAEKMLHSRKNAGGEARHHKALTAAAIKSPEDLLKFEKKKIRDAINTDMVLSGEIIVVTLGVVAASPFMTQLAVLSAIGVGVTVGIYGLVAGIVKLDDMGLHMMKSKGEGALGKSLRASGAKLVSAVPTIMKTLAIAGTAAMLAVGGGLILHGIPGVEHAIEGFARSISANGLLQGGIGMAIEGMAGIAAGVGAVLAAKPVEKLIKTFKKKPIPEKNPVTPEIKSTLLEKTAEMQVKASLNENAAPESGEKIKPAAKPKGYIPPVP